MAIYGHIWPYRVGLERNRLGWTATEHSILQTKCKTTMHCYKACISWSNVSIQKKEALRFMLIHESDSELWYWASFDCSRASLALTALTAPEHHLLCTPMLHLWATLSHCYRAHVCVRRDQLWMDRVHALQHFTQKMSKHIYGYLLSCIRRSASCILCCFMFIFSLFSLSLCLAFCLSVLKLFTFVLVMFWLSEPCVGVWSLNRYQRPPPQINMCIYAQIDTSLIFTLINNFCPNMSRNNVFVSTWPSFVPTALVSQPGFRPPSNPSFTSLAGVSWEVARRLGLPVMGRSQRCKLDESVHLPLRLSLVSPEK